MRSLEEGEGTEAAREVHIGENVYIGDGCIIEDGVHIGNNAIVRAGSVVVQHALAIAYDADGQVREAVDLLESVVEIKTRVLRADHPSLLVSVEVLADIYADLAVDSDEAPSSSSLGSPTMAGPAQSVM
ncbi:hypothetical protein N0V95_009941 [Ascochyta clinopodiicola]|nr:hypothetical protein N0V95_009941 [Ascochyta clinopodiicola]